MSISVKTAPPVLPQTDIESLRGKAAPTLELEKQRLRKVTKEFESFFLYEVLKNMRRTVKETSLNEEGSMANGMGKDMFTQMFDMEVSRRMATGEKGSVADLLYNSMVKLVEAQYRTEQPLTNDLPGASEKFKNIEKQPDAEPLDIERPVEIDRPEKLLPIESSRPRAVRDPILARYGRYIDEAAREHNLDSALIESVIKVESNGNSRAMSTKGAKGLMQLIDSTAAEVGVTNSLSPRQNIKGGARYLRQMLDRFGDIRTALAAYNAGPGAVSKHGGIPPFKETQEYVDKVMELYDAASK